MSRDNKDQKSTCSDPKAVSLKCTKYTNNGIAFKHKLLENSLNNLSRTELYFTGYTFGIWVSLCRAAGPVCMEIFLTRSDFKFSVEQLPEVVANSIHTADADATKLGQFCRFGLGGVN